MIKRVSKIIGWVFSAVLIWLIYLTLTILNHPVGTLSDRADTAIVLGAALIDDKPSPVFTERLNHAINLYQKDKVKKLIFTGGIGANNEYAESSIARDYAISKQVVAADIFIETESLTTKQNLINAKEILLTKNISSALLVSDALHLTRAMLMAKDLKLNIKASATPTSRYQSLKTRLPFALRELYFYHHYLFFSE